MIENNLQLGVTRECLLEFERALRSLDGYEMFLKMQRASMAEIINELKADIAFYEKTNHEPINRDH